MRVLLTTQPVRMHFLPMLPVVRALQQAGHDVAVACAPRFRPWVERLGVATHPAGLDWSDATAHAVFPDLERLPETEKRVWYAAGLFAGLAAHRMVPDLSEVCRSWSPALLLRNDFEFASLVVGERQGLHYATVGVEAGIPAAHLKGLVGRPLAQLRAAHRLPPDPECAAAHRHLYLSLLPPSCQAPEFLGTASVRSIRPLEDEPGAGTRHGEPRPVVSVSLESGARDLAEELRQFSYEPWIAPEGAWPRGDLVVTDGCFADVVGALASGLPMLILPDHSPQPFHIPRWETLGLARIVGRDGLRGETLRGHLQALLAEPGYRSRAAQVRRESLALPGPAHAVELLEALAVRSRPRATA